MSDSDKPQEPSATPPAAPDAAGTPPAAAGPPAEQPPPRRPPRERPPRAAQRGSPSPGKVPALDERDLSYGFGQKADLFDAELERDLETDVQAAMAGLSDSDLADLYGEGKRGKKEPQPAGPRKGKVISIRGKDVFVDVGGRTQGVLPIMQFEEGPPAIGTEVEVSIEGYDPDGFLLLTRKGAVVEADWSSVAVGMVVEARVTGTNKGGLSVDVNGIRGFLPVSQIDLYRVEDLEQYNNQRLRCLVTEVDREERNLVLSRRALLEKEREEGREKLWTELQEGQVREGVVRSIKPFGAFVDIGGADGLLPVGEMSWTRIKSPEEVVAPGQRVRVQVIRLDRDARKITLGLKQLTASPWDQAALDYPPGSVVKGKVTRTAEFGAFVEIAPGLEGLVHVSELAPQRVRRVTDVVKEGQEVNVKVLSLDAEARRMSLSIKQALKAPEPEPAEAEEEEEAGPAPPPRRRDTPLRGGVGHKEFKKPEPPE
jgi:small subunit ribosomal protein S1